MVNCIQNAVSCMDWLFLLSVILFLFRSLSSLCTGCWEALSPTRLKKQLKGRHFSSDEEIFAAANTWLDGQLSDFFFLSGLQKLEFGRCSMFPSWSGQGLISNPIYSFPTWLILHSHTTGLTDVLIRRTITTGIKSLLHSSIYFGSLLHRAVYF